jgi:hypothetical protein
MDSVMAMFTVEGDSEELLAAYDRALPKLQAAAGEIGSPQIHVCAPADHGLTIVDVWESGDALGRFAEHPRFREIIREAGLPEPSAVKVSPVHTVGWPADELVAQSH